MKVLNVIPGLAAITGGPAFVAIDMATALKKLGVEVSIFASDIITPAQAEDRRYGAQASDLPAGADQLDIQLFPVATPKRILYSPKLNEALKLRAGEFDLIHIHSLFLYPQLAAWRAARRSGIAYVVSPHGSLDPFLRQRRKVLKALMNASWQRSMLKGADAIHVTAEEEGAQLRSLGYDGNLRVSPIGVGPDWFNELPPGELFRERFLDGFAGLLILFHGRLTVKKGLDVLLAAVSLIRRQGTPVHLALVGPDEEGLWRILQAKVRDLKLEGCVTFVGMLAGDDLRGAVSAADVWAMPSHGENFGIAVLEALAAGLPVVISPQVNIAGAIEREGAAVIADRSSEAFATAIERLLHDPGERQRLGARARRFAESYDSNAVARRMYELYEEAILNRRTG